MSKLIATWFYTGLLPKAPGTWGSLAALPFVYVMLAFGMGPVSLVLMVVIVSLIGWWATIQETKGRENHDPGEIVIDEVAGQWLTFLPIFIAQPAFAQTGLLLLSGFSCLLIFALGFGLFRLFDITKIGPVGWADRLDTAWGVMLDDLVAGLMAAISLAVLLVGYIALIGPAG